MEFLLEFGVAAIAEELGRRTDAIARQAAALGLTCAAVGTRAPHFLSLGFPDGLPDGLGDMLGRKHIHVSVRGNSLRVTPHLYNRADDADALLAALKDCLA